MKVPMLGNWNEYLNGHVMVYKIKNNLRIYPLGIHWHYAKKGGRPCLREEVNFRNINGVWIGLPNRRIFMFFRRVYRWGSR